MKKSVCDEFPPLKATRDWSKVNLVVSDAIPCVRGRYTTTYSVPREIYIPSTPTVLGMSACERRDLDITGADHSFKISADPTL